MKKRLLMAGDDFLRGPTGQRLVREVGRQIADPANRRRVTELARRIRTGRSRVVVVDADPMVPDAGAFTGAGGEDGLANG